MGERESLYEYGDPDAEIDKALLQWLHGREVEARDLTVLVRMIERNGQDVQTRYGGLGRKHLPTLISYMLEVHQRGTSEEVDALLRTYGVPETALTPQETEERRPWMAPSPGGKGTNPARQ